MSANQWASQATTPNAAIIRGGSASVIVVWVLQAALAASCLMVGSTILTGTPPMANVFLSLLHKLGMDDIKSFGDSTDEFALNV